MFLAKGKKYSKHRRQERDEEAQARAFAPFRPREGYHALLREVSCMIPSFHEGPESLELLVTVSLPDFAIRGHPARGCIGPLKGRGVAALRVCGNARKLRACISRKQMPEELISAPVQGCGTNLQKTIRPPRPSDLQPREANGVGFPK